VKRYLAMNRYIGKIVQPTVKRTSSFIIDDTIAKRKRTKEDTMIYKILLRKLKIEQHESQGKKSAVSSGAQKVIPSHSTTLNDS
jgi:hypothetical protein